MENCQGSSTNILGLLNLEVTVNPAKKSIKLVNYGALYGEQNSGTVSEYVDEWSTIAAAFTYSLEIEP